MDIKNVKPEWFAAQLEAGRDIKHIADYLGSSRREVTGLLKDYGIMGGTNLRRSAGKERSITSYLLKT